MTPDGESGQPAYAISDSPVDSKSSFVVLSLNLLKIVINQRVGIIHMVK